MGGRGKVAAGAATLRGRILDLALLLAALAAALAGPPLVDGLAALAWTRHYASLGTARLRSGELAERAGRSAARVITRTAPLPAAGEAAALGLGLARALEAEDPAAAASLYGHLGRALEAVRSQPLRGLGLDAAAEEARARLAALAARRAPGGGARP